MSITEMNQVKEKKEERKKEGKERIGQCISTDTDSLVLCTIEE